PPSGLAVGEGGDIVVSGELSPEIVRYRVAGGRLERVHSLPLDGVRAIRALAMGPEHKLYVAEEHDDRLITLDLGAPDPVKSRKETRVCGGPFRLAFTGVHLLVDCLFDHAVVVRAVDGKGWVEEEGAVTIRHDGPMWSVAAAEAPGGLL